MKQLSFLSSQQFAQRCTTLEQSLATTLNPSSFKDDVETLVKDVARCLEYPTSSDLWENNFLHYPLGGLSAAVKNGYIPNDLADRLKNLHLSFTTRSAIADEALQRVRARVPGEADGLGPRTNPEVTKIAQSCTNLEQSLADAKRPGSFADHVDELLRSVAKAVGFSTSTNRWKTSFLRVGCGLDLVTKGRFISEDLAQRLRDLHVSVIRNVNFADRQKALDRVRARARSAASLQTHALTSSLYARSRSAIPGPSPFQGREDFAAMMRRRAGEPPLPQSRNLSAVPPAAPHATAAGQPNRPSTAQHQWPPPPQKSRYFPSEQGTPAQQQLQSLRTTGSNPLNELRYTALTFEGYPQGAVVPSHVVQQSSSNEQRNNPPRERIPTPPTPNTQFVDDLIGNDTQAFKHWSHLQRRGPGGNSPQSHGYGTSR
jgi:hypothetical protein